MRYGPSELVNFHSFQIAFIHLYYAGEIFRRGEALCAALRCSACTVRPRVSSFTDMKRTLHSFSFLFKLSSHFCVMFPFFLFLSSSSSPFLFVIIIVITFSFVSSSHTLFTPHIQFGLNILMLRFKLFI